jgi:hypothetical protein
MIKDMNLIKKILLITAGAVLSVFSVWNFYTGAIRYNPLSEVTAKTSGAKEAEVLLSFKYSAAWTKDIHEKNLFSPNRSYMEPVPVAAVNVPPPPPPPRKPEMLLKGIVLDLFGDNIAYIEIDKAKALPMRKGDKTDDIDVIDVSDRKVVLKWNNEIIELSVDKIKTISNPRATR